MYNKLEESTVAVSLLLPGFNSAALVLFRNGAAETPLA